MSFPAIVWDYYHQHGRAFPWRERITPYKILVSELMLQQTQTQRIETRFPQFLKRFPSLRELAAASQSEVLQEWQGLGYNRRGKYLHEAAKFFESEYDGIIPEDPRLLQKAPGIGLYTAAALPCFAYNKPTVFIETNIRTVYLHHFFRGQTEVDDKAILPLIARDVDASNPREWYYALMDYGVYLKRTFGSLNHQSKHYRKQSKFAGSNRQVRATLLKHVLIKPHTLPQLRAYFSPTEKRLRTNLQALLDEGFLVEKQGRYFPA